MDRTTMPMDEDEDDGGQQQQQQQNQQSPVSTSQRSQSRSRLLASSTRRSSRTSSSTSASGRRPDATTSSREGKPRQPRSGAARARARPRQLMVDDDDGPNANDGNDDDDDGGEDCGLAVVNSTTCLVAPPIAHDDDLEDSPSSDSAGGGGSQRRWRPPRSHQTSTTSGRTASYTIPAESTAAPGKFRYLRPEEIESGRAPAYDYAVIVNRSIPEPTLWAKWRHAICGCGCLANGACGMPMDDATGAAGAHGRRGFRRLCQTTAQVVRASEDEQRRVIDRLVGQGLFVDIIDGGHSKGEMNSEFFILLVRATDEVVNAFVTHFRDNLWVEHGAIVDLEQDLVDRAAPPTPAERVQIVDYIIGQRAHLSTSDPWIHDMFPMHDRHLTDQLITQWVASWRLFDQNDKKILKSLRSNFGEKVTYYFAFINYYNRALIPIAVLGVLFQILHGVIPTTMYMRILPFWGIGVSVLWSFSFLKSWDRKNAVMQYEWNKKLNVKQITYPNRFFYGEQRVNSLTGELETVYPAWRRLPKFFCVFLFMLLQTVIMLVLVAIWVTIYEILKAKYPVSHIFSTQWFLILLEGMVFGIFVDVIQWNIVVTKMGALFTHWENYRTEEQYEKALIRKLFLLDFLNYYTWFFSLAFVFVIPGFGDYLMNSLNHMLFGDAMNCCFGPYVDQHGKCIKCPVGPNVDTCIECVGYFTFDRSHVDLSAMFVTPIIVTQSLNIALQVIAPVLVRKRREQAREAADAAAQQRVMEAGSMKILGSLDYEGKTSSHFDNKSHARYLEFTPSQIEVLNKKAREILFESEQDTYDPYNDFHSLTVQYGFTVMFSILWPLMPFACFMINSLKRRTDGYRLCKTLKRPIPRKSNGIGGWRGILTVYAYVAVIVNVLLICISTGSIEFFNATCVRDIEHQLEKQGKTLDDFIFGPNFGCLHISWRLLIILVMEHILICGAYLSMTRLPRVPTWITTLMHARERRFKEILRTHEATLFPSQVSRSNQMTSGPSSFGNVSKGYDKDSVGSGSSRMALSSGFIDLTAGGENPVHDPSFSSRSSVTIDVEAITPLSEQSASDLEEPSSNGFRTRGREQLARQWADDE